MIEPLSVPINKHTLRDPMILYKTILKMNEIIEELNQIEKRVEKGLKQGKIAQSK